MINCKCKHPIETHSDDKSIGCMWEGCLCTKTKPDDKPLPGSGPSFDEIQCALGKCDCIHIDEKRARKLIALLRRIQPYASGMGNITLYEEIEKAIGDLDAD